MGEPGATLWAGTMPAAYDRFLAAPVFRPFAVDLASRLAAAVAGLHRSADGFSAPGKPRVLELAAGTGALTREILGAVPDAQVTATDLNEAMVEYGRAAVPAASWQAADALALPFVDDHFDAVLCQFGVMFLPDKAAGFAEACRVLAPGGRLIVNTWDHVGEHGYADALMTALGRLFPDDPPSFIVTTPHGYHDPDELADDVRAGGLDPVAVRAVTCESTAASAREVATGFCTGTPLRAALEQRGDLDELTARVGAEMESLLGSGPITCRMRAHVVEAVPGRRVRGAAPAAS